VGHAWRVSHSSFLPPLEISRSRVSYTNNSFTECDADSAYPPGIYPLANGSTSTFAQRYTGTYTVGSSTGTYTIGYTVTPQTAYSTPASSNCITYTSVGNGEFGI
jgi:hypothetical protein